MCDENCKSSCSLYATRQKCVVKSPKKWHPANNSDDHTLIQYIRVLKTFSDVKSTIVRNL